MPYSLLTCGILFGIYLIRYYGYTIIAAFYIH